MTMSGTKKYKLGGTKHGLKRLPKFGFMRNTKCIMKNNGYTHVK
jgi:hypothetical protein